MNTSDTSNKTNTKPLINGTIITNTSRNLPTAKDQTWSPKDRAKIEKAIAFYERKKQFLLIQGTTGMVGVIANAATAVSIPLSAGLLIANVTAELLKEDITGDASAELLVEIIKKNIIKKTSPAFLKVLLNFAPDMIKYGRVIVEAHEDAKKIKSLEQALSTGDFSQVENLPEISKEDEKYYFSGESLLNSFSNDVDLFAVFNLLEAGIDRGGDVWDWGKNQLDKWSADQAQKELEEAKAKADAEAEAERLKKIADAEAKAKADAKAEVIITDDLKTLKEEETSINSQIKLLEEQKVRGYMSSDGKLHTGVLTKDDEDKLKKLRERLKSNLKKQLVIEVENTIAQVEYYPYFSLNNKADTTVPTDTVVNNTETSAPTSQPSLLSKIGDGLNRVNPLAILKAKKEQALEKQRLAYAKSMKEYKAHIQRSIDRDPSMEYFYSSKYQDEHQNMFGTISCSNINPSEAHNFSSPVGGSFTSPFSSLSNEIAPFKIPPFLTIDDILRNPKFKEFAQNIAGNEAHKQLCSYDRELHESFQDESPLSDEDRSTMEDMHDLVDCLRKYES